MNTNNTASAMAEPLSIELQQIHWEARRICDECGYTTLEQLQKVESYLVQQAFMRAIEPYIKLKLQILSCAMPPRYFFNADVSFDRAELCTMPKEIQQLDELIADIRKSYEV